MTRKNKFFIIASLILAFSCLFATTSFASEAVSAEEIAAEENVFTTVFLGVKEYATEIFCALTFTGSLLLAYAYKKGLLPLVESTLVSIGNAVSKIKERTEASEESSLAIASSISNELNKAQDLIKNLTKRVDVMSEAITEVKDGELLKNRENQSLCIIVGAQIDMLYDIFMSSALPQYQKDAVGERVAKMKEALAENEAKQ